MSNSNHNFSEYAKITITLYSCHKCCYSAVIITNGPQKTSVCVTQFVNFSCGFTGADPNLAVPSWHIIKRKRSGAILYDETISGLGLNSSEDGLEWIADPHNGNNSAYLIPFLTRWKMFI